MQISAHILFPAALICTILLSSITILLFSLSSPQSLHKSLSSNPITNQSNPQSNPQFVVVRGGGHGLCNTMGHIACSLYLAEVNAVPNVAFYWRTEDHLLEAFAPIPNLQLIHSDEAYLALRDSPIGIEYEDLRGCETGFDDELMEMLEISGDALQELWTRMYGKFRPTFYVDRLSRHFVSSHQICTSLAVHVRRTDYGDNGEPDDFFFEQINSIYSSMRVFLLTDNNITRQAYIDSLGSHRVIIFGSLESQLNRQRSSSIVHAVTEMMIATYARYFIGTKGSSFSKTVRVFRDVYAERRQELCG